MTRTPPLVLLAATALGVYFTYHTIYGTHGTQARARLTERASVLALEIAGLEAERARLEIDVAALAREPADGDLVEEIARAVLGHARPGEIVVTGPLAGPASAPRR